MDPNGKITVRYLDRKFVKNVIRHTDVHNRRQEQDEMWRARKSELKETSRKRKHSSSRSRSRKKKELNDDYHRLANNVKREITKCNPLNSDRWTHNGFLELYPEESISKLSMDEESEEEKKISKSKHKRIKKKKSKKKRQQSESSDSTITTDSSSNEGQTSEEERKKHKRSVKHRKKRKKKKKKHKKAEK